MREYWISYEVKTIWVGGNELVPDDIEHFWDVISLKEDEVFEEVLKIFQEDLYRKHSSDSWQAGSITILNVSKL